jgi:hypothetical protein
VVLTRIMKLFLPGVAIVALALTWSAQRFTTAHLQVQVGALREQGHELNSLRAEREQLRGRQIDSATFQKLQHDAAEHRRVRQELDSRAEAAGANKTASFIGGDQRPAQAWRNRGQESPSATIETTLWAAAGGDVVTLKDLLLIEGSTRTQALDLIARLSSDARVHYTTPEHLIAAFTLKAIPLGDAQLVWQQQNGPDDAVACVVLREQNPTEPPPPPAGSAEKVPPSLSSKWKITSAYLGLRRSNDGWRLIVPVAAVEKIAKELGSPK